MIDRICFWIIYIGMPVVGWYHHIHENIFLNVAATDANIVERMGNYLLTPAQYLIDGKIAIQTDEGYELQPHFDYTHHLTLKLSAAVVALPISVISGSLVKGLAYILPDTQRRHQAIADSTSFVSHNHDYENLGIDLSHFQRPDLLEPPKHKRRPGEEWHMAKEKECMANIIDLFNQNKIVYWLDCGTCLGAIRYGGIIPWDTDVDLAVLEPDFSNIWHLLKSLDKSKYHVQDWSARDCPQTYIRVYCKQTHSHLDIYFFAIDAENEKVASILSSANTAFLPNSWKIREGRFTVPTPYDVVFPLKKGYFDGLEVFVPNQTKKYLQLRYGDNIEPAKIYNETTQTYEKDPTHPYWQRSHVY